MRNVVLARIDERMLHGQVCTKWMQATHANVIVLADDDLVNDKFTCKIFMGMKPAGTELEILTVEQAITYLQEDSPANEKVMLLTKCAQSFLRMREQGAAYEKIICGSADDFLIRRTLLPHTQKALCTFGEQHDLLVCRGILLQICNRLLHCQNF